MYQRHAVRIIALIGIFCVADISAMNFLRPYDPLLIRYWELDDNFTLFAYAEGGVKRTHGYNDDRNCVDVLRIYNPKQDALAMLEGFPEDSPISQLNQEIDAIDDGVRGNFLVDGALKLKGAGGVSVWAPFRQQFAISAHLPFFSMKLDPINWCNLTQNNTDEDERVRSLLTDNFCANVFELGNGLDLGPWHRSGVGDLTVVAHWFRPFPQTRPFLKQVFIQGRLGLNFPTGLRQDEDKVFAIPFGYDGSLGILFGGGLDAQLGCYTHIGFDVELLHLFGTTRERRIKTAVNQTEFLLLAKTCVYKDVGFTQKFSLYVEIDRLKIPFTLLAGYQYFKHNDDDFWLSTQQYSQNIANTSHRLREYSMHQAYFSISYKGHTHCIKSQEVLPSVNLYSRIPLVGKNAALTSVVGVQFSLKF